MAVSSRSMVRQRDYSRLFIALGVLAGVVAIAPIVAAVMGLGTPAVTPKTAFASAPAGEYAVIGRADGESDVISVAWAGRPGAVTEVARVRRMEGFTSTGAVSPDGKKLALVTVDAGSRVHPIGALLVVELETGRISRLAENVAAGQTPVWHPDGETIVITRAPSASESLTTVHLLQVSLGGSEDIVKEFRSVLGVYPVGFDGIGALVSVVIGATGSIVERAGSAALPISGNLTRDWKLSPDGNELAFIDVDTSNGVRYLARTVALTGQPGVSAAALTSAVSALGTAWNPANRTPSFGLEPGAASAGASSQSLVAAGGPQSGFDVPLGYSASGTSLVVTHYTGASFQEPGTPELQVVTPDGRAGYENYTRFYGWSAR